MVGVYMCFHVQRYRTDKTPLNPSHAVRLSARHITSHTNTHVDGRDSVESLASSLYTTT